MRSLVGSIVNRLGIKPILIKYYEKIYMRIQTIQMYVLMPFDNAWNARNGLNVMTIEETIKYIICNSCSVARFGDGEFNIVSGRGIGFQSQNNQLTSRLKSILNETKLEQSTCLVALPGVFRDETDYEPYTRRFWKKILVRKRKQWYSECSRNYLYGNADITRCYLELNDRSHSLRYFELLKQVWEKKDVVIIEGEKSRLGVGNDLFDNCNSIKRILCPSLDAFRAIDKITSYIRENINQDQLLLIALGPTATVMAYELDKCGYQAIDIGNIDKEYEWCISNAEHKTVNPLKFTLEVKGGSEVVECTDEAYLESIIERI